MDRVISVCSKEGADLVRVDIVSLLRCGYQFCMGGIKDFFWWGDHNLAQGREACLLKETRHDDLERHS